MFEGSFFKGTGVGHAYAPRFQVRAQSSASAQQVQGLVRQAVAASPLLASWATPLHNTFALYANGRRVTLRELASSTATVDDPFKTWSQAPTPLANTDTLQDIVSKAQPVEVKNPTSPSGWEAGRVDIPIHGHSELAGDLGRSVTWANRLGGSAYAIQSDDRLMGDQAPSALAHAYAGIAFCFMTQLLRTPNIITSTPWKRSYTFTWETWTLLEQSSTSASGPARPTAKRIGREQNSSSILESMALL
jgi:hypothetical protein